MAQLDFYCKAISKYGSDGVVFKSNAPVAMRFPTGDRYGKEKVAHDVLVKVIMEIATPEAKAYLAQGQGADFVYEYEGSPYWLQVKIGAGVWNASIAAHAPVQDESGPPSIDNPYGETLELDVEEPVAGYQADQGATHTGASAGHDQAPALAVDDKALEAGTQVQAPAANVPAADASSEPMTRERLHQILSVGVKHGASDIHLRPGAPPCYRVAGTMRASRHGRLSAKDTRDIVVLVSDEMTDQQERRLREADSSYSLPGCARFRVNIFRQRGTMSLVLRIIPAEVPTIESLKLPEVIRGIADNERGLVLVTGATGSGKSSTLAAMIDHINRTRSLHILTIEDPIEFLHPDRQSFVSQREIGPDTDSFAIGLRAALRQDPDVILVGEMRDKESIDVALKAAETGHMVFSTVHTTDASKTISRICGVFPAEEQNGIRLRLADNLKGTISQRLISRADGNGRVLVQEIMVATSTTKEMIRENRVGEIKDALEKGRDQYGMQSFDQHLTQLFKTGIVTRDTAMAAASNPTDFERALNFS